MKPAARIFRIFLFVAYVCAVAWLCFGEFKPDPDMPRRLWGIPMDKLVHFLMFLPFPLLAYFAVGKHPAGPWKALGEMLLIFLVGALVAAGTEIGQSFFPYRTTDPKDFLADTIALAVCSLAVFIVMLIHGIRSTRTDR